MAPSAIAPVSFRLHTADPDAFAQALGGSFARYGFAVVADHGLDQGLIDAALDRAKAFFALPEADKLACRPVGSLGQRGYTPFGVEAAKGAAHVDLKEFWHVGRDLPEGHPNASVMPPNVYPPVEGWEATHDLYRALDAFGLHLLRAIARYLGLADDFFEDTVRDGNSVLRLLHYPPQDTPQPEGSIRAAAHEDINTITLLLGAEEAGLEVKDRSGEWLPINPPPGCLVVNIGDMLQRATNHVLPSTSHRVVNPSPERQNRPRYSTPFFLHFRPDYLIETIPSCITPDNPNRYPEPITAHDYLMERLREIKLA